MKDLVKYLVQEIKMQKRLDKMMEDRVIQFDTFFKYSGKTEEQVKRFYQGRKNYSAFFDKPADYVPLPTPKQLQIKNDMSKYKLKNRYQIWKEINQMS
tara:strand:- start:6175 stop:6468 length:294 start_codon:yes stop_codon:yes gene_type:complete